MTTETGSTVGSITDDILWSECPEDLYLRRILQEQYQDEGTIVDSVMGDSTVAGILSDNKLSREDNRYDGRSWLNFSPIAGSVMTEGTTSEEESSPSFVESSIGSTMNQINSSQQKSLLASTVRRDGDMKNNPVPDNIKPRFIDFDEESSTGSLSVMRIPEVVDLAELYDEEATEVDGTRAGLSTLSGDTFLRNIGMPPIQPDYKRSWIDARQINYAKPSTDGTGTTSKSSKQDSNNTEQRRNQTRTKSSQESTNQTNNTSNAGCCSRFIQKMIDDDKVFRRTVVISMLFITIFASLSAFALIRSSDMLDSTDPSAASAPTPNPTTPFGSPTLEDHINDLNTGTENIQGTIVPVGPTLTTTPSLSPHEDGAQETSVERPGTAPNISDPFRFVSNLIFERSPGSMDALGDSQSPQHQAFLWSISDLQRITDISEERIVQRWVLALLFYSLDGEYWTRSDDWLSGNDVCTWFTTSPESICNDLGLLTHLDLEGNNLQGRLPTELELLSSSLIGINLNNNRISGTLPIALGNIPLLETLNLSSNQLTGAIPTDLARLSQLQYLELESNDLTGDMPSDICTRRNEGLSLLLVDCEQVSCSCCDSC